MKIHSQEEIIEEIKRKTGIEVKKILHEYGYFLNSFSEWVEKIGLNFESDKDKVRKFITANLVYPLDENDLHFLEEYTYCIFAGHKNVPLKIQEKTNNTEDFVNKILSIRNKNFKRIMLISKLDNGLWDCDRFERDQIRCLIL